MLPDSFPVFHIDLDCDFESSDNVYPPFGKPAKPINKSEQTLLQQKETATIFTTIG